MDNLNRSGENVAEMEETNFITLLKNPEKFKETFADLQNIASQNLKSQQNDKALKALTKCADMLDLGKNILKDISKYSKLCINANLACAYQGYLYSYPSTWKMQKCNKYCEKVQQQLQKLLEAAESRQNYLNLTKCLIRIRFQHCAILSQLNQHEKALQLCKLTLSSLDRYTRSILEYAESLRSCSDSSKSLETVQFSKQVSSFAEDILKNLIKNLTEPLNQAYDKSSFYYWQKNPENNEDQVKKRFVTGKSNDECKRSILGVNKMSHWIDEFNIGTIMHMSELSIKDFENCLPIEEYIFKDKLYETVIYCSVAHFTIATEMRFIQSNRDKERDKEKEKQKEKQKQKQKQKEEGQSKPTTSQIVPNTTSIIKKYGFKQKSQMFMMSELYHLRAIHIIAQNIKSTVPYISHLIKSYDKHYIYKKQLEPVVAIDEESLISINDFNTFKNKQEKNQTKEEQQNAYYAGEGEKLQPKISECEEEDFNLFPSFKNVKVAQCEDVQEQMDPLQPITSEYLSGTKKRNKSEGKIGYKANRDKIKSKMNEGEKKQKKLQKQKSPRVIKDKKKKNDQIQGEVRINHQSTTQIKVVFKKKK